LALLHGDQIGIGGLRTAHLDVDTRPIRRRRHGVVFDLADLRPNLGGAVKLGDLLVIVRFLLEPEGKVLGNALIAA
jgi:hypothetical protein